MTLTSIMSIELQKSNCGFRPLCIECFSLYIKSSVKKGVLTQRPWVFKRQTFSLMSRSYSWHLVQLVEWIWLVCVHFKRLQRLYSIQHNLNEWHSLCEYLFYLLSANCTYTVVEPAIRISTTDKLNILTHFNWSKHVELNLHPHVQLYLWLIIDLSVFFSKLSS